jgi:hypothetical protein
MIGRDIFKSNRKIKEVNMKRILFLFAVLPVLLTACAPNSTVQLDRLGTEIQFTLPGENPAINTEGANGKVAGFGTGLWHGFVALITLFVSFFNPAVQMYSCLAFLVF